MISNETLQGQLGIGQEDCRSALNLIPKKAPSAAGRPCSLFLLLVVYSLGLRTREGLGIEVGDIDGNQHRVHIRNGKGGKDRYVTLPQLTLSVMRRFWGTHRHPRLLFPSPAGGELMGKPVNKSMDASGIQGAFRATIAECGIKKKLSIRSLHHA